MRLPICKSMSPALRWSLLGLAFGMLIPLAGFDLALCLGDLALIVDLFGLDEIGLVAQRPGDGGDGGVLRALGVALKPIGERLRLDRRQPLDVPVFQALTLNDGSDPVDHRVFIGEIIGAVQPQRAAFLAVALSHGRPPLAWRIRSDPWR